MFTLCIPTMNRYDKYLKNVLDKYISNELIDEIIITDENGDDIKKINKIFKNDKLKLYKNEKRLGPFLNKLKACKLAKNEWIALIDSDNFADIDYFKTAEKFIKNNNLKKNTILSPCYASSVFRWEHLSKINKPMNKLTFKKFEDEDNKNLKMGKIRHIMNLGNYILNSYLTSNININKDIDLIKISYCFDVVLMNTIFYEQFNIDFWIIDNMKYKHVTSNDSIYKTTCNKYKKLANETYDRLYKYIK